MATKKNTSVATAKKSTAGGTRRKTAATKRLDPAEGAVQPPSSAPAASAPRGPSLGQRIRSLRRDRDWSLNQLAQASDIAPSTLSKVENDILTLNYDRLAAVATAFGMSLSEFLAEPRAHKSGARPVMGRRSRFRCDQGEIVDTPNYEYRYLCTDLVVKHMVPIFSVVKARSLEEFGPLLRHEGEEMVLVIKGEVTVHTEFYAPEVLPAMHGIYIDSPMGHAYVNSGDGEAWILSVNTAPHPVNPRPAGSRA
jgi:ribosome-binding protein aMBF1 (putative translation factor)